MESELLLPIAIILLLIAISAFFSGSETGLTAVSRATLQKLRKSGNKKAGKAVKLREDKDALIGTILLGNNAVNILASAIATSLAIKYFGDDGVIYATVIMTMFVLVFAEVLPKTYAFYNPTKISLLVAPVFILLVKILSPITHLVQIMVSFVLNFFNVSKEDSDSGISSKDELRGAIDLHHEEGSVVKGERDMLDSILDLSKIDVEDVMIHRKKIFSLDINTPTQDVIENALSSKYTRVPIWENTPENIIGILHVKDLLKGIIGNKKTSIKDTYIKDIATKPWFVPETNSLSNQLLQFRKKKVHMAMVIDEYGDLVGLVTLEDVLEEIVGQIEDEHDNVPKFIRKLKDGGYRIKGDTTLRDINRQLGWELPDDEAATIAGFVINIAENIPEERQKFEYEDVLFEIVKKKDNQLTSIFAKKKLP